MPTLLRLSIPVLLPVAVLIRGIMPAIIIVLDFSSVYVIDGDSCAKGNQHLNPVPFIDGIQPQFVTGYTYTTMYCNDRYRYCEIRYVKITGQNNS